MIELALYLLVLGLHPKTEVHQQTFIASAEAECRAEHKFYLPHDHALTPQELSWLQLLVRFTYSGEVVHLPNGQEYSFDWKSDLHISDSQMMAHLKNSEYSSWLGSDLLALIQKLRARRNNIQNMASHMYGKNSVIFVTQVHPEISEYWKIQKQIIALASEKWALRQISKAGQCP